SGGSHDDHAPYPRTVHVPVSVAPTSPRSGRRGHAQPPREHRPGRVCAGRSRARSRPWEFLISSGAVVPTGAQRDVIKRGNLTAAQLTYVVRPSVAVTATLGWGRSRDITLQ